MRKFSTFILIIILTAFVTLSANAFSITAQGTAIIDDDKNSMATDLQARNNALKSSLAQYFRILAEQSGKEAPDVTDEFLKFIKSYTILERYVDGHTLVYKVYVDIDDIALNDINYYIKQITNSAVIANKGVSPSTEESANLVEAAEKILKENSFTTIHNRAFQKVLPVMPSEEEINKLFLDSRAQYLFIFDITPSYSTSDGEYICDVTLTTSIGSKKQKLSKMQTTASSAADSRDACFTKAYEEAVGKTVKYVRNKFIVLPENQMVKTSYNVEVHNFTKFVQINNLTDILIKRNIITGHKIKEYAIGNIKLEFESYFSREDIIEKLKSLEEKLGFGCKCDDEESIIIDYSPEKTAE